MQSTAYGDTEPHTFCRSSGVNLVTKVSAPASASRSQMYFFF